MQLTMELVWNRTLTIVLLMLSECFIKFDCWSIPVLNSSDSSKPSLDVTYDDIRNINGTCEGLDSCESPKRRDSIESYNCNCNSNCGLFGTCCVDSKHRHRYPKPLEHLHCESFSQGERSYLLPMIRRCDPDLRSNKTSVELCKSLTLPSDDPVLKVPVTDLVTGISYQNYHCFSCNKNYGGQEPIPWNLEFWSRSGKVNGSLENLRFDTSKRTWILDYDQANATDVFFNVTIPDAVISLNPDCFSYRTISDCASNWTDNSTRSKCLSYMALTRIPTNVYDEVMIMYYQNPHCAICNYQSIDNMYCKEYKDNHSVKKIAPHRIKYGTIKPTYFPVYTLFHLKSHEAVIPCFATMVYDRSAKKCRNVYKPKKRQLMLRKWAILD